MSANLRDPSVGLDAATGGILTGWEHVVQSLRDIFDTRFGSRIMREWYGSFVPNLLGRLITPEEVVPYFAAITHYRLAHALHRLGARFVARLIAEIAHGATGIDIHPAASIGDSFFIDHGTGVVIGETAIIGHNVRIYQAVTLGAARFPVSADGALIKGTPRHPIIEDDVVIYAGATVLGRITVGKGSVIGGNVWLTHSVPPGSTITQAQMQHE